MPNIGQNMPQNGPFWAYIGIQIGAKPAPTRFSRKFKPNRPRKALPKHWYLYYDDAGCVLCGSDYGTTKRRMYTPKPENPEDRWENVPQHACSGHFI